MHKLLLLATLFLFSDAQYVTQSYYSDSNCATLMASETATINNCVNSNTSSMKYVVCNSSLVFGYIYTGNNCNPGSQLATITQTPNTCISLGPYYEKYTCASSPPSPPSPPPPPSTGPNNVKVYIGSPTCSGVPSITKDFTVNNCIDYSQGGFSVSYKFTACNSTIAIGSTYMNNICSGSPSSTFNAPVGVCYNNNGDGEFYTCGATSSKTISSLANNLYHMNIFIFFVITLSSMIFI